MILWLFPVSHIQLISRSAGAGREHSQTDSPSWPVEIVYTIDVMLNLWIGVGREAGRSQIFLFLQVQIHASPEVQISLGIWPFLEFRESCENLESVWSPFRDWLWIGHRVVKKVCCIQLFCIFIIMNIIIVISITIISSISISFAVLLNCLYLNPWVLPIVHFSFPSRWGGRGGVSEQLSSA